MKPPCARCGWIHSPDQVRTVGRFGPAPAYRGDYPGAPLRPTRLAALVDVCDHKAHEETP